MTERVVLTKMQVRFEGGCMDGEERELNGRDVMVVTFGMHRPDFTVLDTYRRTIDIHHPTGRTIFRHDAQRLIPFNTKATFLDKLVALVGFHKPTINL